MALIGGLLAFWRIPETVELELIEVVFCGSETVRRDGTRRVRETSSDGERLGIISESELGMSKGVLAAEESSTELGDAGLLVGSSRASGEELLSRSAMTGVGVVGLDRCSVSNMRYAMLRICRGCSRQVSSGRGSGSADDWV